MRSVFYRFFFIAVIHIDPSEQWNYYYDNERTNTYPSNSQFNFGLFPTYFDTAQSSCQCIKLRNCAPFVDIIRRSSSTAHSRSFLESLRGKICGYDGTEVKVCCPTLDQRRRRDNFQSDATEEPWVWDVETTTASPHSYMNVHNRFGPSENSDFHNFLKPHRTEFGDVDSSFNEFHSHHRRKNTFHKHETYFHFEDPETFKNCPQAISHEFELPEIFKDVVPPVQITPLPVIPVTTPENSEPVADPVATTDDQTDDQTDAQTDAKTDTQTDAQMGRDEKLKLINSQFCGISVNTRIIGGEDAGPGQFPWMARLAYRNKSKLQHKFYSVKSVSWNSSIGTKITFQRHKWLSFLQSTIPFHCRSNTFEL